MNEIENKAETEEEGYVKEILKELKGCTILMVKCEYINQETSEITFDTDQGKLIFKVESHCCRQPGKIENIFFGIKEQ